jgi:outer membrane protein assembly factor BamB
MPLLLALALAAPPAENWPAFRGPRGDGTAAGNPVSQWSEAQHVRWKVPVHGKGWSSPVVWGDQVWVTTAADRGTDFHAICFDRNTGKVVHDRKLFSQPPPADIRQFNTYASCTPAVEAGRLYAHFGSFGTACLDTATGDTLWLRQDLPCDHWRGPASSVCLWQDRLFLLYDGHDRQYVACLDKATGATRWKTDRQLPYPSDGDLKKGFATAAVLDVGGSPQVVAPAAMGTVAYHPDTGAELWKVVTGGMNEASRPLLANGLILVTTGHTNGLWAVKPGGEVAWKLTKIAPSRPSPVVSGDHVYLVNDTGTALCLDAKTGAVVWKETLGSKFSASPVLAAGRLYFFGEDGRGFVLPASPEFSPPTVSKLDGGVRASPAVAGDDLFVRTYTHLYRIGAGPTP